jgi:hypothetical protein
MKPPKAMPPTKLAAYYRAIAKEQRDAALTADPSLRADHLRLAEGWEGLADAIEAPAKNVD